MKLRRRSGSRSSKCFGKYMRSTLFVSAAGHRLHIPTSGHVHSFRSCPGIEIGSPAPMRTTAPRRISGSSSANSLCFDGATPALDGLCNRVVGLFSRHTFAHRTRVTSKPASEADGSSSTASATWRTKPLSRIASIVAIVASSVRHSDDSRPTPRCPERLMA